MTTYLTARVIVEAPNTEAYHVDLCVRAAPRKPQRLGGQLSNSTDAWGAFSERPVFVAVNGERVGLLHQEQESDTLRSTIREAAEDMRNALILLLRRPHARLVWGTVDPLPPAGSFRNLGL